jgi:hypothetical protein
MQLHVNVGGLVQQGDRRETWIFPDVLLRVMPSVVMVMMWMIMVALIIIITIIFRAMINQSCSMFAVRYITVRLGRHSC